MPSDQSCVGNDLPLRGDFWDTTILVDGKECGTYGKPNVELLMSLSEVAPFGRGDQTLVDAKVRDARHIMGERITTPPPPPPKSNPYNYYNHRKPVQEPAKPLQPPRDIPLNLGGFYLSAKLAKMHLYSEKGKFIAHRDTCHNAGHLASLVVGLPTDYEGGELEVQTRDGIESFGGANKGWYAMFFTDSFHEIKPVTRGSRISLQFDLYIQSKDYCQSKAKNAASLSGPQDPNTGCGTLEWFENDVDDYELEALPTSTECDAYVDSPTETSHTTNADNFLVAAIEAYRVKQPERTHIAFLTKNYYSLSNLRVELLRGVDKHLAELLKPFGVVSVHPVMLHQVLASEDDDIDESEAYSVSLFTLFPYTDRAKAKKSACVEVFLGSITNQYVQQLIHQPGYNAGNHAETGENAYYSSVILLKFPPGEVGVHEHEPDAKRSKIVENEEKSDGEEEEEEDEDEE